jgi:hypothetical protein
VAAKVWLEAVLKDRLFLVFTLALVRKVPEVLQREEVVQHQVLHYKAATVVVVAVVVVADTTVVEAVVFKGTVDMVAVVDRDTLIRCT